MTLLGGGGIKVYQRGCREENRVVDQSYGRISITNLEHVYSFVNQKDVRQSGYGCSAAMLAEKYKVIY